MTEATFSNGNADYTSAQADEAIAAGLEEYIGEGSQAEKDAGIVKHAPKSLAKLDVDYDVTSVEGKLLDAVYGPYNDLVEKINNFKSMGDLDTLAKNEIENAEPESEIGALRDRLKLMRDKIAQTEKLLTETSRAQAAEKLDPDFDELKARTDIKETRAHANEMFKIAFSTFEVLGHVETIKEPLKSPELVAIDDIGESLLAAMNTPNIKGTKGSAPQGDSKTTLVREWAKAQGKDVSDRGRIAADIIAEYDAAHSA